MSQSPARRSLTARTAGLVLAKTLAFVFGLALPLLLVRRLDQEQFGVYKQLFLFVDTALSFLAFGFGLSAFYFGPREPSRQGAIVFNIMLFNVAIGGLAFVTLFFWPGILGATFNDSMLNQYAAPVGFVVFLWLVTSFLEVIPLVHGEFKLATIVIVVSRLSKSAFLFIAAVALPSVGALVYAAILQGVLQCIGLLTYLRSRFPNFWRQFNWDLMRKQLSYTWPHGVAGMLYVASMSIDNYIVSYQYGASTYAIYAVGLLNIPLVAVINDSVGTVMISRISDLQARGQTREIIELTARMIRKIAAAYLPLYVLLLVVGREFIEVLFTKRYLASWPVFAINAALIPTGIVLMATDPIIRAHFEHRYLATKVFGVLLPLFVAPIWFATKYYGVVGAVSAALALTLTSRMVVAVQVGRILNITRRDLALVKDIWKIGAAAVIGGAAAAMARSATLGQPALLILTICAVILCFVYLSTILLFGLPTPEERDAVRRCWHGARKRLSLRALLLKG